MTADVELLPLPPVLLNWPHPTNHVAIRNYAHANVEHHTESLRAELDRVLGEHVRVRRELAASKSRAERLAEAKPDEWVLVPREMLEAAVCPMGESGCDGTQYPVQPYGEGEQCQWCYERRASLSAQQPTAALPDVDDDDLTVAYMAGRHDGRKEAQHPTTVDRVKELIEDASLALNLLESEGHGEGYTAGILRNSIARCRGRRELMVPPGQQPAVAERVSVADVLRIVNTAIDVCNDASRPAMAEDLESVRLYVEQTTCPPDQQPAAAEPDGYIHYQTVHWVDYSVCADEPRSGSAARRFELARREGTPFFLRPPPPAAETLAALLDEAQEP